MVKGEGASGEEVRVAHCVVQAQFSRKSPLTATAPAAGLFPSLVKWRDPQAGWDSATSQRMEPRHALRDAGLASSAGAWEARRN